MLPESPPPKREINILLISTLLLAATTLVFAVLAIVAFGDNQHAQNILTSAEKTAYSNGQAAQHKTDQQNASTAAELPFRDYKAPELYGGFDIKFPKDWNAYVVENEQDQTQVNLLINPDAVIEEGSDLTKNSYAFRAVLLNETSSSVANDFDNKVKDQGSKLTKKGVTVSKIASTEYTGQFDQTHTGVLVLVPVRDKTLELITDSNSYLTEFNQILAQSTIVQ